MTREEWAALPEPPGRAYKRGDMVLTWTHGHVIPAEIDLTPYFDRHRFRRVVAVRRLTRRGDAYPIALVPLWQVRLWDIRRG